MRSAKSQRPQQLSFNLFLQEPEPVRDDPTGFPIFEVADLEPFDEDLYQDSDGFWN